MSEPQSQTTATSVQFPTTSAFAERDTGRGDFIFEERQAELQAYLDRWAAETDHGERKGLFDRGQMRPLPCYTSAIDSSSIRTMDAKGTENVVL